MLVCASMKASEYFMDMYKEGVVEDTIRTVVTLILRGSISPWLYRMVSESWESVQAKRFVPLFPRGTIFSRVRIACRNAATAELMDVSGLYNLNE